MAGKGGYQQPNNPAPVSGPGSLSLLVLMLDQELVQKQ